MKKVFWLGCMALMLFPFTISARAADDEPQANTPSAEDKSPPFRLPEYWLGVRLRVDEQGIIVQEVVPDSPAAKAGFAQNDVIVKVNDKKITDVSEVLQAVEAAKDKEMKLEKSATGSPKLL